MEEKEYFLFLFLIYLIQLEKLEELVKMLKDYPNNITLQVNQEDLVIMLFVNFILDVIIYNIDIKYNNIEYCNVFLLISWKISQYSTVGYLQIKKRELENKNIIQQIIKVFNYLRNNTYYRIFLWNEFQSLDNFISLGKTSIFYREHIILIFYILYLKPFR